MGMRILTECRALSLSRSGMGAAGPEDGRDEASQAEDGEYEGLGDKGEE